MNIQLQFSPPARARPGIFAKILLSLILLAFLVGGCFLTFEILKSTAAAFATSRWNATPCQITRARLPEKSPYKCNIAYTYDVAGKTYTSHNIYDGYNGSEDFYDAEKIIERFPVESRRSCLVNPADPTQSGLMPPGFATTLLLPLPLLFILISLAGLVAIWRYKPVPAFPTAASPVLARRNSKILQAFFWGIFFLAGAGAAAWSAAILQRGIAAGQWTQCPAQIRSASVVAHTTHDKHGDHVNYAVAVLFHYDYLGRKHASSRYQIVSSASSDPAEAQQIVDTLLQHKSTVCYVNPNDPDDAVLDRHFARPLLLAGLCSLLFMTVGGFGLFFLIRQARIDHRRDLEHHLATPQAGPVALRPGLSNTLRFAILLFPTLIWNAVVVVAALAVIPPWLTGHGDLAPTLIVALLAVVGIWLFLVALGNTRLLYYPACHLTISHLPLVPGQPADLHWQFHGDTQRLARIQFILAAYRAAPIYHPAAVHKAAFKPDLAPVYKTTLLETTKPAQIPLGRLTFAIPPTLDAAPLDPAHASGVHIGAVESSAAQPQYIAADDAALTAVQHAANNSSAINPSDIASSPAPALNPASLSWQIELDADLDSPSQLQEQFPLRLAP
jgi:hypothetical protein